MPVVADGDDVAAAEADVVLRQLADHHRHVFSGNQRYILAHCPRLVRKPVLHLPPLVHQISSWSGLTFLLVEQAAGENYDLNRVIQTVVACRHQVGDGVWHQLCLYVEAEHDQDVFQPYHPLWARKSVECCDTNIKYQ